MNFIDTHTHLDGEEFKNDLTDVVTRAKEAGVTKVFIPAIDLPSIKTVLDTCALYPDFAYPMIGLHPEEVKEDYRTVLASMKVMLDKDNSFIAIGEVGLDYYWSREYEKEQLDAFEEYVKWSIEYQKPLMIHCRKAQNEMLHILKLYENKLPGGVFHCFTGNEKEADELLAFDKFVLGIGGVLTFKKSHLPEVLPHIPIERIVLETDAPYMAPVPMRGQRNESAYIIYVIKKMAECYNMSEDEICNITNENVSRVFGTLKS